MNESLEMRLNIAHAAVARAKTSRPTGWLDDQILGVADEDVPAPPPSVEQRRARRNLNREQAEKMVADLEGYDSQIVRGRLVEGQ